MYYTNLSDGITNPDKSDLNSYVKTGAYTIGGSKVYQHAPYNTAGSLIVRKCGIYIKQEYTTYTGKFAWRTSVDSGSTWKDWNTAVSISDFAFYIDNSQAANVKLLYEKDSEGCFLRLVHNDKSVAFWRVSGTYPIN